MTDERIKVGFVGCGGIATGLYTGIYGALAEHAQVVAVADLDAGLARRRTEMLGHSYRAEAHAARVAATDAKTDAEREAATSKASASESAAAYDIRMYRDHEELLGDDEVELVCVFTPPTIRAVPIVAAAQAGRHVYTEGPLAKSVEEADAIKDAVKAAGVKFPCPGRRPLPARYGCGAEGGGARAAGGPSAARTSSSTATALRATTAQWGDPGSSFQPRKWHGTWEGEGGGAVFHHGRYIIDPFLWVVGSRVAEVFAYSGPMLRTIEHDSLTQAVVAFENGATGYIHATLISHLSGNMPGIRGRINVLGQDAAIMIDQEMPAEGIYSDLTVASNENPSAVESIRALEAELAPDFPEYVSQEDQTRLFLENIANDTEPLVPIEIPHHHVELTRAIYKSAEEHRPVTLPLDKDDPFYSFEGSSDRHGVRGTTHLLPRPRLRLASDTLRALSALCGNPSRRLT